jgi:hypothetical protein
MSTTLQEATDAIHAYTYGMDTNRWRYATSHFADEIDVDYSQVGAPKALMSNQELQQFLQGLLGKPGLRVHTAISQVLENPTTAGEYRAYYSVRHYKGEMNQAETFFVFGWYRYRLQNRKVISPAINGQAMEGNPAIPA